jgi:sugar phosphate isomerase/epimerase
MNESLFRFGISTTVDYSVPIENQLDIISACHFDFISVGANLNHSRFLDRAYFPSVIERAMAMGLPIESVHAPYAGIYDLASAATETRDKALEGICKFLNMSSAHGIPLVILHPHHYFADSKEACLERIVRSLEKLDMLRPNGAEIALENLPGKESSWIFSRLMGIFDATKFGFCYDSSHENISGEPFHLIGKFHDRLTTTHLSDNLGQNDDHLIPGEGIIEWSALKRHILKATRLKGLLFEVGTGEKLGEPLEQFVGRAADRAREIFAGENEV